jgi:hypothetical protein
MDAGLKPGLQPGLHNLSPVLRKDMVNRALMALHRTE